MNTLNAETTSAAVNPQKNEEVKKKLKLVRAQLENLEQTTSQRQGPRCKVSKGLTEAFQKNDY